MTRVTLTPLANLSNGTTATTTINANSTTLNNTFDRVLWLDGTAPNQMQAALDMNSNQIINLAPPATMNSPARLVDVATNPTIVVPGTGTSGHLVPFLDGTNTWAGAGSNTFAGGVTFQSTTTFPAANIAGAAIANAGITTTQIATNTVANSNLAQMATNTIKGNNTGGTANAADLTVVQVAALFSAPQVTVFTTGTATYTTPTNTKYLVVEIVGGGAGGSGSGTGGGSGTAGGNTTFGTSLLTANGGAGGVVGGTFAAGGTSTGGDFNATGGAGSGGSLLVNGSGGLGGTSFYGGPGACISAANGGAANAFGSGGAGGGEGASTTAAQYGVGGGAGGYLRKLITSPAASYNYAVGAAGVGGGAGTSGFAGGNGFAGLITITAYFQ